MKKNFLIGLFQNVLLLAAFSALSIMVACIISDLVYFVPRQHDKNWHDPNTKFDKELGWAPIPNRSIVAFRDKKISSNSLGFRSPEADKTKEHILIVGDSVAWGHGLSDDETVSFFLQKDLNNKYNNLQVLNLGVSGYGIDQYYMWLKKNIQKTNPKVVIVIIYSGNDVAETGRNYAWGKSKPLFSVDGNGELVNIKPHLSKYSFVNVESTFSFFYMPFIHDWVKQMARKEKISLNVDSRRIVIRKLIAALHELVSQYHAQILFVLSPCREDYKEETGGLQLLRSCLQDPSYHYLDFLSEAKRDNLEAEVLYLNDRSRGHYSSYGSKLFAEKLYNYLDQNLL